VKTPSYIVDSDGITVWVNGEGGLLGRFGKYGIDIHRPVGEQSAYGECLFCTHAETTYMDWRTFCKKMRTIFGVRVAVRHMPKRFR